MKYNERLFDLVDKYVTWAKFDWCALVYNDHEMYGVDMEEHKKCTISAIIRLILENGMLNECFTRNELSDLITLAPKRFRKEIEKYV